MRSALGFIVIISAIILVMLLGFKAFASSSEDRLPPMTKKNKNEVTDFFVKEIEDKEELEQSLEESQSAAVSDIESKANLAVSSEIRELENIDQGEAEARSYQVRMENSEFLNNTRLDYNDPQLITHQKDTDKIATASEKFMHKLAEKLKELGIDCRQKKGATPREPEMYIEIEQEEQKEIIYDKYLCEFLRNQYSCRDSLT